MPNASAACAPLDPRPPSNALRPAHSPPPTATRVRHIDGVAIPTIWPEPKPNGKVRTTAAVATARALIRPHEWRGGASISFPPDLGTDAVATNHIIHGGITNEVGNAPDEIEKDFDLVSRRSHARKTLGDRSLRPPAQRSDLRDHGKGPLSDSRVSSFQPIADTCARAIVPPPTHGGHMPKTNVPAAVKTARSARAVRQLVLLRTDAKMPPLS